MERGIDRLWDHLVDVLRTIGDVSDRAPHGLVVSVEREGEADQVVEIDMTRREWDDMTAIGGWHLDSGAQHVRELVLRQPRELRYLSYANYELTPATTWWQRR
ncbi:hypothetical protein KDN32_15295 [Nocardioides sp. J2M5]|uniref:hypothetical protein n=1 Tax=Nocardioides palaemonis TaxID=2829810 RepID=UPI001BA4A4AB|nr:hypothetical protein [Nocardioides palaemonis]MBS2939105.1 hypothetical protein [Nocardioides palaemonis]